VTRGLLAAVLAGLPLATAPRALEPATVAGETITFRITYLRMLAGRAWLRTVPGAGGGAVHFIEEAKSQGFFAWLFHFKVDDRTVAEFDPATGSSLGIEKHLREGKATREQMVRIDPTTGIASVQDPKIAQTHFELQPGVLDILSALHVVRVRGFADGEPLELPVFDNGKHYKLGVRLLGRDALDLPLPLGKRAAIVVEPQLLEGTGLFVKEGRLKIWLTDDAHHIPVKMQARVAIGSVTADLERYESGN
jgi:hypothetical protein